MLNSIELTGFKSFAQTTMPLRPLTLLCGMNNSGKSSIIQALRMFCNSHEKGSATLLAGHGSIEELRSRFVSATDPIVISCRFDSAASDALVISETELSFPKNAPLSCYISADRWGPKLTLPLDRQLNLFPTIGDHGEFVIGFLNTLENMLVPEALHHPKAQGATLKYEVSGWLEEIAPGVTLNYGVDSKRDTSHIEFDAHRPMNVGFGLSYCLPILVAILGMAAGKPSQGWDEAQTWGRKWEISKAKRGLLLMLENPEAHLHPKGQTALGHLIALGVKCGLQIVVETQSDHLMDGIRLAVLDGDITPEQVVFHYMARNADEETTYISPEIEASGKLSFWPEGFFDQTLKNRKRLAR